MEYTYRRVSAKDFEETVVAVEREVSARGFRMSHVHDISATLASKGFSIRPLRIYEIEGPEEERDEMLELLMPCRLNVYEEGDTVIVAVIRPSVVSCLFPDKPLAAIAERVERRVAEVVDGATA